jgi:hypothetical protein
MYTARTGTVRTSLAILGVTIVNRGKVTQQGNIIENIIWFKEYKNILKLIIS